MMMINNLIQQKLGAIIQQEVQNTKALITITEVDTAPDLRNAKVLVSIFGKSSHQDILKKLNARAPYLQHLVGQQIKLKRVPQFVFRMDVGIEHADTIDRLFKKIEKEEEQE